MPVLVTGASGFLGGRLVEMLREAGEAVRVLARPTARLEYTADSAVEVVRGSFAEPEILRRAVAGVRRIYHCAGCSTDWAPWPAFHEANVLGVQALLSAVRDSSSIDRFVHVSTTDVYGYPRAACDESAPGVDAGLPYNRSKWMGENLVFQAFREWGLPVTILRPASIYGPRGKAFTLDFATHIRRGSMTVVDGGRSRAGLAYVDNVAAAMMAAAASPGTLGRAYNLADGTGVTWREYVDALADGLGARRARLNLPARVAFALARTMEFAHGPVRLPGRPLLTRHAVLILCRDQEFPAGRARADFGFVPRVALEEGIRRSIEWLKGR